MRILWILFLVQFMSMGAYGQNGASVIGETQDCFAGKVIHPGKVDVYLFDPLKSSEIQSILSDLKRQAPVGNDTNVTPFFNSLERLKREVRRSKPLGHVRSDAAGQFSFDGLKADTKTLLLGIAEREDDPAYYAYTSLTLRPGKNSVTLDFCEGTCNPR